MPKSNTCFSRLSGHLLSALLAGLLVLAGGLQPTPTAAQNIFSSPSSVDGNSVPEQIVNQPCTACEPLTVQTADLDGDGDKEVLSGSKVDGKIAWHENLGGGQFSSQNVVKENPITPPKSVDLGNLDGDGDIDILSAEGRATTDEDDELVWYENDGNGNFSARNTIGDIGFAGGARLEDLDNDDDGDIIATVDGGLVWYRNTDSGFATPDTIQADFQGRLPSITDLNGDGYEDLLRGSSSMVIWSENLDGQGFASPDTLSSNLDNVQEIIGTDLDGDGDQDILFTNFIRGFSENETEVRWIENLDDGGFSSSTTIAPDIGGIVALDAGDVDADDDTDIVIGSGFDPERILWLENDGSESFSSAQTLTTDVSDKLSVRLADLDGDGVTDLVSASSQADQVSWHESRLDQGDGVVSRVINEIPDAPGLLSIDVADVEGDGDLDVLSASGARANVFSDARSNNKIAWYENRGGEFASQDTIRTPTTTPSMVHASDLDGDGDSDVLVPLPEDSKIVWYETLDDESFSSENVLTNSLPDARVVHTADLDSDGDSDIIAGGRREFGWFENLDDGGFSSYNQVATFDRITLALDAADLDGDGNTEIIAAIDKFADIVAWYEMGTDGTFSKVNEVEVRTPVSIFTTDLDGDDDPDLLAAQRLSDEISWYENLDDGGFSSENRITSDAGGASSVHAADLDGDGDQDVLSASSEFTKNKVAWYENLDDDNGFSEQKIISEKALGAFEVEAGDLNGNSSPDVLSASGKDDKIAWYANTAVRGGPQAPSGLSATATDAPAADLTWDAVEDTVSRYRVYRDTESITGSPSDLTPVDSVTAPDTTLTDTAAAGDTYYYRVTAVDTAGTESGFSGEARAFLYPSEVTASVDRSFGDASDSTDYRLVALPGRASRPLADAIGGQAGTDWQAYRDDGSDEDFFVRYSSSGDFAFETGNGFWLTATDGWTNSGTVSTVDLRGDSAAKIPLRQGWNVISNPTGKNVAWSRVQAQTPDTLQAIYGFDGTFSQADTFRSATAGVAYYFLNDDTDRDSLVIPYPGAPAAGAGSSSKARSESPSLLALTARPAGDEERPASTVKIGLSETARPGLGPEDLVAPPGRFAETSLRIDAPGDPRSERGRFLMTERRPAGAEGQTFALRLTHRAEGPVQISASNLDALEGRSVALLNPSAGTSHDLRADGPVRVETSGETTDLTVAIGSKEYVQEKTDAVRPEQVRLTSYPNPVRSQGTISYALPERAEVTLRVYDLLGRRVATLASGQKEAGRHTVPLETSRLSSGVYFGRLQADGQTRTQKITVVR